MTVVKAYMPDGKDVYNARMPDGKDVYKVAVLCEACAPSAVPDPNNFDPNTSTVWFKQGAATVSPDVQESPGCAVDADLLAVGPASGDYLSIYFAVLTFTPFASMDVGLWVRRVSTTGVVRMATFNGSGSWNLDMALLPDTWALVNAAHPAVTVVTPFAADSQGAFDIDFIRDGASTVRQFHAWCMYVEEI